MFPQGEGSRECEPMSMIFFLKCEQFLKYEQISNSKQILNFEIFKKIEQILKSKQNLNI
jgi:hypothetical protein